ncbi:MAG: L,D-transpeptidase family protein [Phycisphaerales bacterium JB060]
MSLPSQGGIGFGGATRGRSRRGRGGNGKKALLAVIVLLVGGGLVWAFRSGDKPAQDETRATAELAQSETRQPDSRLVSVPQTKPETRPGTRPQDRPSLGQQQTSERPIDQPMADTRIAERRDPQPASVVLATPAQTEPVTIAPAASGRPSAAVATLLERAEEALKSNKPIAAREYYNQALMHERATASDRASIRQQMQDLNQDLIFSPRVYPGDPFSTVYEVQGGDSLARIAQREGVATEYLLIQRVNRMSNPNSIYEGQKLKLVRGPFHAVVSKTAFRMDVYVGPPDETDQWMYVRSFPVGLGEHDGTPVGAFTVRRHSKLIDPFWRNPRTGEEFAADDPQNPIGDHWIGLRGLGQAETYSGYGIHGTIDPDSIGKEMSMGCVRMLPDDVALVYELLTENISQVHIVE